MVILQTLSLIKSHIPWWQVLKNILQPQMSNGWWGFADLPLWWLVLQRLGPCYLHSPASVELWVQSHYLRRSLYRPQCTWIQQHFNIIAVRACKLHWYVFTKSESVGMCSGSQWFSCNRQCPRFNESKGLLCHSLKLAMCPFFPHGKHSMIRSSVQGIWAAHIWNVVLVWVGGYPWRQLLWHLENGLSYPLKALLTKACVSSIAWQ